jgi:hypothetical protein
MNLIDDLAMMIASKGAGDFYDGKSIAEPENYWYTVGYLIASEKMSPEDAIEKAKTMVPEKKWAAL